MIMQKQTCAVFIGILLSSCSAKRASFDIRLHARPATGHGQLVVYQKGSQVGYFGFRSIAAGGVELGNLRSNSFLSYSLAPGIFSIRASGLGQRSPKVPPISIEIKENQITFVWLDLQAVSHKILVRCGETDDAVHIRERTIYTPEFVLMTEAEALQDLLLLKESI